jgi:hypothetical protein
MGKIRTLPADLAADGIPANVDAKWDGGKYDVAAMKKLLAERCATIHTPHACACVYVRRPHGLTSSTVHAAEAARGG